MWWTCFCSFFLRLWHILALEIYIWWMCEILYACMRTHDTDVEWIFFFLLMCLQFYSFEFCIINCHTFDRNVYSAFDSFFGVLLGFVINLHFCSNDLDQIRFHCYTKIQLICNQFKLIPKGKKINDQIITVIEVNRVSCSSWFYFLDCQISNKSRWLLQNVWMQCMFCLSLHAKDNIFVWLYFHIKFLSMWSSNINKRNLCSQLQLQL